MRLLHTTTFGFEEFFDSKVPRYAILSHRWEDREVTFQNFEIGKEQAWPGFVKIKSCCSLAQSRGFEWVWIDTCCIDKKSSAELSEAINSMFRLYAEAGECYAYLSDVLSNKRLDSEGGFKQSAWFTRGWTLQELLAPSSVIFYDRTWNRIGYRKQLLREISDVTGIGVQYLNDMREASVATKMSWISKRQTSRLEDMAYCLLGLFDVNMPLLYGEGRKAFLRLELEIIKKSDDESIFAWTSPNALNKSSGLLALWPDSFADSADVRVPDPTSSDGYVAEIGAWARRPMGSAIRPSYMMMNSITQGASNSPITHGVPSFLIRVPNFEIRPYTMTNKGLEFSAELHVLPALQLNCWKNVNGDHLNIIIDLRKRGNSWERVGYQESKDWSPNTNGPMTNAENIQTIYIKQDGL